MSVLRHWKIILCLAAIVGVSALAGWLVGHRSARQQLEKRNDLESWNVHVGQVFERMVKPSPEQGAKIQAHLDRAVRELQTIRSDTIARSTNVIWRLVAEVEAELTPEQRKAFEAMKPKPGELTLDVLKVKSPADDKP
jgi:hypothetical protein